MKLLEYSWPWVELEKIAVSFMHFTSVYAVRVCCEDVE